MSNETKQVELDGDDLARLELIRDHDGNDLSEKDKTLLSRLVEANPPQRGDEEPEQVETVDHRAEAERLLSLAKGARVPVDAQTFSLAAHARASLAIAEELKRLREQFEDGAIEVMYGGETV